ncbi:hypothetical protein SAMN04488515_0700 [Cognatiyoonia koreensis]|uniref:Uncharacterized protein n=1 Tax=Cognatiyoonia koreensis TaxID=364200 RepID=A0A1I0NM96_9RHOB|nr:hypothetical protein [Cognatiyoonia koreensis]SEW02369.1 hypothetical protein SAMN04488515_0700 [Cognatiyoonia koreensis]
MSVARTRCLGLIAGLFWASPALADDCTVRVNAMDVAINAEAFDAGARTIPETVLAWPKQGISRLRGRLPTCPGDLTLEFMAGLEGLPDTDGYCLAEGSEEVGLLLVPGERNFRGQCATSVCQKVTGTADEMVDMTGMLASFVYAPEDNPNVSTLTHASGALMMTATREYVRQSLAGGSTTTLGTLLGSTTFLTAAAVTVVGVGGGVYLCSD